MYIIIHIKSVYETESDYHPSLYSQAMHIPIIYRHDYEKEELFQLNFEVTVQLEMMGIKFKEIRSLQIGYKNDDRFKLRR